MSRRYASDPAPLWLEVLLALATFAVFAVIGVLLAWRG